MGGKGRGKNGRNVLGNEDVHGRGGNVWQGSVEDSCMAEYRLLPSSFPPSYSLFSNIKDV